MANKYLAKYKRRQPFIMDISPDDELEMDFISGEVQDIKGEQAISDDLQLSKAEKKALQKDINNRIVMLQKRAKKIHCPARKRKVLKEIKSLKQGSAQTNYKRMKSVSLIVGATGAYAVLALPQILNGERVNINLARPQQLTKGLAAFFGFATISAVVQAYVKKR